jgi:SEC-C motif-containing protein
MATAAQIEANRTNAAASTGPTTAEGKFKSSRNAVSHGLFAAFNPYDADSNEAEAFNELTAGMEKDLAPEGALEQTFAVEITRATCPLRRCANVEDSLFVDRTQTDLDLMANTASTPNQIAVDRARAEAHRILKRSMDELRRLQNERRFRFEVLLPGVDTGDLGLASYKDLMPAMAAEKRWQRLKRQEEGLGSFQSMLELAVNSPAAIPATIAPVTKQTQSPPEAPISIDIAPTKRTQTPVTTRHSVPRNAPCPCGSGQKHKRCCGTNAPAVLNAGAVDVTKALAA